METVGNRVVVRKPLTVILPRRKIETFSSERRCARNTTTRTIDGSEVLKVYEADRRRMVRGNTAVIETGYKRVEKLKVKSILTFCFQ